MSRAERPFRAVHFRVYQIHRRTPSQSALKDLALPVSTHRPGPTFSLYFYPAFPTCNLQDPVLARVTGPVRRFESLFGRYVLLQYLSLRHTTREVDAA